LFPPSVRGRDCEEKRAAAGRTPQANAKKAKKAKNAKNAKALRHGVSYKIVMICLVVSKKKTADEKNADLGTHPPARQERRGIRRASNRIDIKSCHSRESGNPASTIYCFLLDPRFRGDDKNVVAIFRIQPRLFALGELCALAANIQKMRGQTGQTGQIGQNGRAAIIDGGKQRSWNSPFAGMTTFIMRGQTGQTGQIGQNGRPRCLKYG